jgi:hypothetical protein
LLKHLGDLRRNAITMHIPVTPQMTQEALAVGKRQRLPDALSLLTHRVQHHLPGKPLLCRAPDIARTCRSRWRSVPWRYSPGHCAAALLTFPRDNRPWREKAVIGPRWPSRDSVAMQSAIVSPVPITATRASGAIAVRLSARHGLAISAGWS